MLCVQTLKLSYLYHINLHPNYSVWQWSMFVFVRMWHMFVYVYICLILFIDTPFSVCKLFLLLKIGALMEHYYLLEIFLWTLCGMVAVEALLITAFKCNRQYLCGLVIHWNRNHFLVFFFVSFILRSFWRLYLKTMTVTKEYRNFTIFTARMCLVNFLLYIVLLFPSTQDYVFGSAVFISLGNNICSSETLKLSSMIKMSRAIDNLTEW